MTTWPAATRPLAAWGIAEEPVAEADRLDEIFALCDIVTVLRHISPIIDAWYLTDLPLPRAASAEELARHVSDAVDTRAVTTSCHPTPSDALRSALERADPADRIVVFGSFFTLFGVLQHGLPRLEAKHL